MDTEHLTRYACQPACIDSFQLRDMKSPASTALISLTGAGTKRGDIHCYLKFLSQVITHVEGAAM